MFVNRFSQLYKKNSGLHLLVKRTTTSLFLRFSSESRISFTQLRYKATFSSVETPVANYSELLSLSHMDLLRTQKESAFIHIDLDAFYCQVEHQRCGIPRDVPLGVAQWENFIAINYPARALGVSRHDIVSKSLEKYDTLRAVHVEVLDEDGQPVDDKKGTISIDAALEARAIERWKHTLNRLNIPVPEVIPKSASEVDMTFVKASLSRYRFASKLIFGIFNQCVPEHCLQKASVDEVYLDVSEVARNFLKTGVLPDAFKFEGFTDSHGKQITDFVPYDSRILPLMLEKLKTMNSTYIVSSNLVDVNSADLKAVTYTEDGIFLNDLAEKSENSVDMGASKSTLTQPVIDFQADDGDHLLVASAIIAQCIRLRVRNELDYTCSAGVGHNLMLAKLCSGRNKPFKQTLMPSAAVPALMKRLPLRKIRDLGGLKGLKVEAMAEVAIEKYRQSVLAGKEKVDEEFANLILPPGGAKGSGSGSTPAAHKSVEEEDDMFSDDEIDEDDEGSAPNEPVSKVSLDVSASSRTPIADLLEREGKHLRVNSRFSIPISSSSVTAAAAARFLSLDDLRAEFDEEFAVVVYQLLRGVQTTGITPRMRPKSMLSSKTFEAKKALTLLDTCRLMSLECTELATRVVDEWLQFARMPGTIVLKYRQNSESKVETRHFINSLKYDHASVSGSSSSSSSSSSASSTHGISPPSGISPPKMNGLPQIPSLKPPKGLPTIESPISSSSESSSSSGTSHHSSTENETDGDDCIFKVSEHFEIRLPEQKAIQALHLRDTVARETPRTASGFRSRQMVFNCPLNGLNRQAILDNAILPSGEYKKEVDLTKDTVAASPAAGAGQEVEMRQTLISVVRQEIFNASVAILVGVLRENGLAAEDLRWIEPLARPGDAPIEIMPKYKHYAEEAKEKSRSDKNFGSKSVMKAFSGTGASRAHSTQDGSLNCIMFRCSNVSITLTKFRDSEEQAILNVVRLRDHHREQLKSQGVSKKSADSDLKVIGDPSVYTTDTTALGAGAIKKKGKKASVGTMDEHFKPSSGDSQGDDVVLVSDSKPSIAHQPFVSIADLLKRQGTTNAWEIDEVREKKKSKSVAEQLKAETIPRKRAKRSDDYLEIIELE